MGRVIEVRRIRDKMPRRLWEMKVECGHFHYELVEKFPSPPANVLCRVCASTQRVRRWIATLSEPELDIVRAHPILSRLIPERSKRTSNQVGTPDMPYAQAKAVPFKLDGGLSIQESRPETAQAAPVKAMERYPLPVCMQPRPGAAVPKPLDLASGAVQEGKKAVKAAPKGRRRGQDPDQTHLFDT